MENIQINRLIRSKLYNSIKKKNEVNLLFDILLIIKRS